MIWWDKLVKLVSKVGINFKLYYFENYSIVEYIFYILINVEIQRFYHTIKKNTMFNLSSRAFLGIN